jgi:HEAT repeat protein
MRLYRTQFGLRTVMVIVAAFASLFWALDLHRRSRPPHIWVSWLRAEDASRRQMAVQELGALGPGGDASIPALAQSLLRDGDPRIRVQAAASLSRIVEHGADDRMAETAYAAFAAALRDREPSVRAGAAKALGNAGAAKAQGRRKADPKRALPSLLGATKDHDQWARGSAILAAALVVPDGEAARPDLRAAIAAGLVDESLHVRELALYGFLAVAEKDPSIVVAALGDDDVRVRRAAVSALGRSGPQAMIAATALSAALADRDAEVRAGAARALSHAGLVPRPLPTRR